MLADEKLREAEYFLEKMRSSMENPDAFRWNLSALLSAARSVTFYLQKEFSGDPGFDEWYQARREEMLADDEMRFLNEARINSIHVRAVSPHTVRHVRIHDSVRGSDAIHIDVVRDGEVVETRDSGPSHREPPAPRPSESQTSYFFQEFPGGEKDVLEVMERHLGKLASLLRQWETQTS